jgi:hypothetical protein
MKKGKTKFNIQEAAGLTVGAVAAAKVANIKLPVNLPAPIQAALPLVLGAFLAGRKGMVGDIGKGMIAVGGTKLIGSLAPGLGIGESTGEEAADSNISDYMIEGTDTYALAGATDGAVGATSYALAGVDRSDNLMFG